MTVMDRSRACLGAVLFLLASRGAAQKPADLTAVLTQIEGQVTLRNASHAAQRQVIRQGESLHLSPGAEVTLICSTERLESLTGPRDWVLDAEACGRGVGLPESSYRNLVAYAGRILPRKGSLLLEMEPRNVDLGLALTLLSPRMTAVMDTAPRLVWTEVPGAVEYEIKVRGPVNLTILVATAELQCGPGSAPWKGLDVCVWKPSGKWPLLEPEKSVSLQLSSRQDSAAPFRPGQGIDEIHLLAADEQRSMKERLRQIAALSMDEASRRLLAAGAYAQSGLYADAIAGYDAALQEREIPEARVTLGDLYLTIGLAALADREYRQVLNVAPADSAVRAAAELGRGQAEYLRKNYGCARAHFETARALYSGLGLSDEADAAREAAELVQAPSGNGSP